MIINISNWSNKIDNMIIIGGSARSGTTIMGKLIHSMDKVEYFFEPPMIMPLLLNRQSIEQDVLKELLSFYMYDQLLLDSLGGRNINLNSHDDSYIYNVKPKKEIDFRLSKSFRRQELEEIAEEYRIAYKMPANVFFDKDLDALFPNNQKIYMHRDLNDTLNSLVGKNWFSDESLNPNSKAQVYAHKIIDNVKIPFWVNVKDELFWVNSDEVNRTAYYYFRVSTSILESSNALIVHYDKFIENPQKYIDIITKRLHLDQTELTKKLIHGIKKTTIERKNLIPLVDSNLLSKIEFISKQIEDKKVL